MILSKHLNKIIGIGLVLALIFSIILILSNKNQGISEASTSLEYEDKLFNTDEVMEINIDIEEEDWDWLIENATLEEYKSCDVTINGETIYNVGIRPKGNSSLSSVANDSTTDRFSFKLDFDEYVDGQTCFGLDKLALNNVMGDNTYMKEVISYELFDYMDVEAPLYNYSNIKVNDEDWGFYVGIEVIEESFLTRNYGNLNGNLYKPEGMGMGGEGNGDENDEGFQNRNNQEMPDINSQEMPDMENREMPEMEDGEMPDMDNAEDNGENNGGMGGFGGMMGGDSGGANLVYNGDDPSNYSTVRDSAVLDSTTDEDFEKVIDMIEHLDSGIDIEEYLDVDQVLRHIAVNTFIVNMDSYFSSMKHNYYLYEENGVCQLLPWDYNLAFGGFQSGDASSVINFPIDNPVTGDDEEMSNTPLVGKLLAVDEYKEKYHEYLEEIVNNYVKNGTMEKRINELDSLINEYVKNDNDSFCTYEEYEESLPVLIQYGYDRAESISLQLSGEQPSTETGTYETSVDLSVLGSMGGEEGRGGFNMGNNKDNEQEENTDDNNNNEYSLNENNMPNGNQDENNQNGNMQNEDMQNEDMKGGGLGFQNGNMQDFESIEKAMDIIGDSEIDNLSDEQLAELEELGINEEMLEQFKNMPMGMGGNSNGNQNSGITKEGLLTFGISMVLFLLAFIFVKKFKIRKYHSV
jgi:spore coat protein CotH